MVPQQIPAEDLAAIMTALVYDLENRPFGPALESAHLQILQGVADNFGAQVDSWGKKWPPRKDKEPHPLLRLSYDLYQAAATAGGTGQVERIGDRSSSIGINLDVIPYARAQNLGHKYVPRWGQTLPAREYYYATEKTLERCDDIIGDYAQRDLF